MILGLWRIQTSSKSALIGTKSDCSCRLVRKLYVKSSKNVWFATGNIFDRTAPLPCSKIPIPGWKECLMKLQCLAVIDKPLDHFNNLFNDDRSNHQDINSAERLLADSWAKRILREADKIETAGKRLVKFRVKLQTGRRHQIRASLAALGLPIFLDRQYDVFSHLYVTPEEIVLNNEFHRQERDQKILNRNHQCSRLNTDTVVGISAADVVGADNRIEAEIQKPKLLSLMDQSLPLEAPLGENALWFASY